MKWNPGQLCSGHFLHSLGLFSLLLTLMVSVSGCATQEQIREATQQTALNTKALVDIEAKKNPQNEGIKEVIAALEKGLGGIPKPEPFQWPDWLQFAAMALGGLLLPGAVNHSFTAGKGSVGMVARILGAISNGKNKGKK